MSHTPFKLEEVVSRRCLELAQVGSEIRRVYMLGQEYKQKNPETNIIDLSLGNPDLEPPIEVKAALTELINSNLPGIHRYTDNAGLLATREFLSKELTKSENTVISPNSVFLTGGAAGALQVVFRTLLDEGDEVIILAPYFCEYVPYSMQQGAKPVIVPAAENHLPDLEKLAATLNEKSKLIIINSPNNPSGVVYPKEVLEKIFALLHAHREKTGRIVHVISDEPYNRLLFNKQTIPPIVSMYDYAWVVRSHSKDLGLAGERIGYLFWGPTLDLPEILSTVRNAGRAVGFVNATAMMQYILPKVYFASVDVSIYEKRVKAFVKILEEGGFSVVEPAGSFFIFPRSPIANDREFCSKLLAYGVLCVPGIGFGSPGFFRASMTQPQAVVEEAAKRIVKCLHDL